jgi:hypothetical protein
LKNAKSENIWRFRSLAIRFIAQFYRRKYDPIPRKMNIPTMSVIDVRKM